MRVSRRLDRPRHSLRKGSRDTAFSVRVEWDENFSSHKDIL